MQQAMAVDSMGLGMNTNIEYRVYGNNAQKALIFGKVEVARLENLLSRFLPDSEISRINENAGIRSVKVSNEVYEVLSNAIRFFDISQGLFDVTISPLIDLWDYKHASVAPEEQQIQKVRSLINSRDIVLNPHKRTAKLQRQRQSIDLGGIGKGFASDRFIKILKENDIKSAFINIGGNISTLGKKPDGTPWRVGIRHPRREGCLLGAVEVTGLAVVTSGDYERFFIDQDGNRRHHILNPKIGYPAMSGLISVTIITDSAIVADALSTTVFIAGLENGLKILTQFPEVAAILVDEYQTIYITQKLNDSFLTTSDNKVKLI